MAVVVASSANSSPETHIPKVSIGMPVYNGEKYIRKALDSLLAQTFTDFELIISDNASTDNTYSICQEYAQKYSRIKVFRQVENRGALWNFKYVFQEAKGEYFMWAAADDIWVANWIENLLNNFSEGVVMSFGRTASIGVNDEILYYFPPMRRLSRAKWVRLAQIILCCYGSGKAILFYSLYRRSNLDNRWFLHEWDNFSIEYIDSYLIFVALQYGNLECDPTAILFKRLHPDSEAIKFQPSSFFIKFLHYIFPYKTIWSRYGFFYSSLSWDVRILLLFILPLDILKLLTIHYWKIFWWFSHRLGRKSKLTGGE